MAKATKTQGMLFSTKTALTVMDSIQFIQPGNWSPKESKQHPLPLLRYPAENKADVIDPVWYATNNPKGVSVVNTKGWSIIFQRRHGKETPGVCLRDKHGSYRNIQHGMFHEAVTYADWDEYLEKVQNPFNDQFLTLWNAMRTKDYNRLVYSDHICSEEREERLGTDKVEKAKKWYAGARDIMIKLNDNSHTQGRILVVKDDLERAYRLFAKAMKKLKRHKEKGVIVPKFKDF